MDLEDRPLEITSGRPFEVCTHEKQAAETHSDGAQDHTSANLLSQSDLNYIIDTVGDISNDGIENFYLSTPTFSENDTPQPIPEYL